jgi:hypothetical protein
MLDFLKKFRLHEVDLAVAENSHAKKIAAMSPKEREAYYESVEAEEFLKAFDVKGASQ